METRKCFFALKWLGLAAATTGGLLFQTTCSISDTLGSLLTSYGLSELLSALTTTTTS